MGGWGGWVDEDAGGFRLRACVKLVLNLGQCRGLQTLDERGVAFANKL